MQSKPRVRQEKLRTSLSFGDLSNTYHLPFERRAHAQTHALTRIHPCCLQPEAEPLLCTGTAVWQIRN